MKEFLSRVASNPAVKRRKIAVKQAWRQWAMWPLNGLRKDRLEKLGLSRAPTLPVVDLDLGLDCGCSHEAWMVELTRNELRPLCGRHRPSIFAPTPLAIDLDRYPDFLSWRRTVSRNTDGKYHRSANKARRLGHATRIIGLKSYARSLHQLTGSKPKRSKGILVLASILPPPPDLVDTGAPPKEPKCPRHWRISWGVFGPTDADGTAETLSACAVLIRSGDVVWIQRMIGHGRALTDGVTKMLMFDIMEWLLERRDPCTHGVRHVVHGFAEEGSIGLFDWKRYLAFTPARLRMT